MSCFGPSWKISFCFHIICFLSILKGPYKRIYNIRLYSIEIYLIITIRTGGTLNECSTESYYLAAPGSRQMDYYKKLFEYRTVGVREYWVVDPERQFVTVYNFEKDNND